ncbi:MAG: cytochrome c biogenesis protein CcdA [Deltaproteobacteria bacterium]
MRLSGSPLDYVFVFLGGVTLSFTPCVYPLIPITASYIGVTAKGSRMRGFLLSLIYTSGIAVTYAALGLAASLTGRLFGAVSAHPVTRLAVGITFVLFGLSMFKVFTVRFPSLATVKSGKKDFFSVFLLGLTSGFIASPCVAPALGAILVYIASTRNLVYGATLLLVFAYGIGLTLIIVGTFSAALLNLPRSGKWMMWFERLAASVMVAIGLYFIADAIRRSV